MREIVSPFFVCQFPSEEAFVFVEEEAGDIELVYHPFEGEGVTIPVSAIPFSECSFSYPSDHGDFEGHISSRSQYLQTLEKLISLIEESNELSKVVLSRAYLEEMPANYNPRRHFETLNTVYPNQFNHWINWPEIGEWMGSSPELLLEVRDGILSTVSLAGTLAVDKGRWTKKEEEEQESVSKFIRSVLSEEGWTILEESGPEEFVTGKIRHLKTSFKAKGGNSVRSILRKLHPTPAVCGLGRKRALQLIQELEVYDRRYYTGYWGLKTDRLERYIVNLRCISIHKQQIAFYMGGGINRLSDPAREWQETEEKRMAIYAHLNEA